MKRIVFIRVGWMQYYGSSEVVIKERPIGGGSYNIKNVGHEELNFKTHSDGTLQGFVQINSTDGGFNLKRIDPDEKEEHIRDVLVIQCATHPTEGGQRVVGWFDNAIVYSGLVNGDEENLFNFESTPDDATLLPLGIAREVLIPRQKGSFGQSNVLYVLDSNGEPRQFPWLADALEFIKNYKDYNVLDSASLNFRKSTEHSTKDKTTSYKQISTYKTSSSNSVVFIPDKSLRQKLCIESDSPLDVIQKLETLYKPVNVDLASFTLRYSAVKELLALVPSARFRILIQPAGGVDKDSAQKLVQAVKDGKLDARQLPARHPLLHAKMYNIYPDQKSDYYSIVGSANTTYGGFIRNLEYSFLEHFDDQKVSPDAPAEWFGELWQQSEAINPEEYTDLESFDLGPLVNEPENTTTGSDLFPYQKDAISDILAGFQMAKDKSSGMLVLPTGAGKTRIASNVVYHLTQSNPKLRVLWLAHSTELIAQAEQDLYNTIVYENKTDFLIQPLYDKFVQERNYPAIFLTTVNRAYAAISEFKQAEVFDLVVIDEAHRAADETDTLMYASVLKGLHYTKILGLTATPYRYWGKQQSLYAYFGDQKKNSIQYYYTNSYEKISNPDNNDSGGKNIFSRLELKECPTGFSFSGNIGDYNKTLHKFKHGNYRRKVVDYVLTEIKQFHKGILLAVDIDHANKLAEKLNQNKPIAQVLHTGKINHAASCLPGLPEGKLNAYFRARIIQEFKRGSIQLLIGVELLSEGLDFPDVDAIFLARPTWSTRLLIQMIGRGMRGPDVGGTELCKIYDFVGQKKHHQNMHDMILDYDSGKLEESNELFEKELQNLSKLDNSKI